MKNLLVLLFLILFSGTIQAQESTLTEEAVEIVVQLENIVNDNGHTLIALYDQERFMIREPLQSGKAAISEGKSNFTFTNVPPGTYAIVALHDENDNNKMDFAPTGMPEEGWATSNNDMSMGPPDFNASKFEVTDQNIQLTIRF